MYEHTYNAHCRYHPTYGHMVIYIQTIVIIQTNVLQYSHYRKWYRRETPVTISGGHWSIVGPDAMAADTVSHVDMCVGGPRTARSRQLRHTVLTCEQAKPDGIGTVGRTP